MAYSPLIKTLNVSRVVVGIKNFGFSLTIVNTVSEFSLITFMLNGILNQQLNQVSS